MGQWMTIYRQLKSDGIEVYSPGQHRGECLSPYTVVRDAGSNQLNGFSSIRTLYDILCYVPQDKFSMLEPYVERVKASMNKLYPAIIPTHFETPSFLDDTVKGHMVSIQYRNNRKL